MPTPYGSDEVAAAVAERLRVAGVSFTTLHVVADERSRDWTVAIALTGGEARRLRVPFSTREGITVPREIADGCAQIVTSGC